MQTTYSNNSLNKTLPPLLMFGGVTILTLVFLSDPLGLSAPGFGGNQMVVAVMGLTLLLVGFTLTEADELRQAGEWGLLALAVLAIAIAADLLLIGSTPGFAAKLLMLAVVVGGVMFIGGMPASVASNPIAALIENITEDVHKVTKFLTLLLQFALLVYVIGQFELENQAFYASVMLVSFYGFIIHYLLPPHYRLPFFLLLSLAAFLGILGFQNGIWLLLIGLVLIGICHLPTSFNIRVAVLLGAGILLALLRVQIMPAVIPGAIWPILGSLFMFRLIIYMYDLRHSKQPVNYGQSLAYFFLLPNIVFPFFPVIDFATFRRTYYKGDRHHIYQTGLEWLFRGAFQLIIYRFINYYLVLAPEDIVDTRQLMQFILTNFLLYLRVSGQFHIVIGLLHLFGFNLPETNNRFVLASSFTDLWRRINIYWKDFMQKVFFMPALFKLNKQSNNVKLAIATIIVFIATWFLHGYQWFWLRGSFPLLAQDILFWTLLATLVTANTLYDANKKKKRSLGKQAWGLKQVVPLALANAGTIGLLSALWSLWTSNSIADWISLWSVAASFSGILTLIAGYLLLTVVLGLVIWITKEGAKSALTKPGKPQFYPAAAKNGGLIALLILLGTPQIYANLGNHVETLMADLRVARLSDRDARTLQRGYYEDLIGVNRFNSELWDVYSKRPTDWPVIQDTELAEFTDDFYLMTLAPSTQIMFHGERFTTNQWGMRDKEYDKTPPADTYRIAVVGPSFVMGSGVADDEVFENLLEERFNQENAETTFSKYELLNFSVSGHSALQELHVFDSEVLEFQPNALFFVAHQLEEQILVRNLANRIQVGSDLPYPFLQELAAQTEINAGMTLPEAERQIKPFSQELLVWTYEKIGSLARENNITPVWVFMPTLETPLEAQDVAELAQIAQNAGFELIDLSSVYEGQSVENIIVAEWDKHPNAFAHQLIADGIYEGLKANNKAIIPGLELK